MKDRWCHQTLREKPVVGMVPREPDAGQAHTGPRDDEVGTRSDRCSLDRWRGKCKVVQGGRGWEGNLEARKRERVREGRRL